MGLLVDICFHSLAACKKTGRIYNGAPGPPGLWLKLIITKKHTHTQKRRRKSLSLLPHKNIHSCSFHDNLWRPSLRREDRPNAEVPLLKFTLSVFRYRLSHKLSNLSMNNLKMGGEKKKNLFLFKLLHNFLKVRPW